jgi:hypothetical protein
MARLRVASLVLVWTWRKCARLVRLINDKLIYPYHKIAVGYVKIRC